MSPLKKEARKFRQYLNKAIAGHSERITHLSVWERDIEQEFPGLDLTKLGLHTGMTKAGTFIWVEWLRDGERCGAAKYDIIENQGGYGAFVEGLLNYPSYRQQAAKMAAFIKTHGEPLHIVPFMPRKLLLQVLLDAESDLKDIFKKDLIWSFILLSPDDLEEESIARIVTRSRAVANRLSKVFAREIVVDRQLARQLQTLEKIERYLEEVTQCVDGIIEADGVKVTIEGLHQHRLASRKLGVHDAGEIFYEEGKIIIEGTRLSLVQLAGMAGQRLKTVAPGTEFDDEIIASARNAGTKLCPTLVLKLINPRIKLVHILQQVGLKSPDKRHAEYDKMIERQKALYAFA